jgi:alkanesulfonate monooxygenase SsuD/methylene tetrahydromethanopterin reductase-like flavin-dependent oxidoreductase (luciferase family)
VPGHRRGGRPARHPPVHEELTDLTATAGLSLNPAGCDGRLLVEAARRAEAAGFDAVWCYDHLSGAVLGADHCLELWSALGAIAAVTERVQLGPLVANVTTRPAAQLAAAAASLQSLSGGRLQLGLGAGASVPSSFAVEMTMFHLEQDGAADRRARVAETIAFLRALWAGDTSFAGRWSSFEDVHGVGIPDPPCPIVVGANGPKMARLAGLLAEGVNVHSFEADVGGLVAVARAAAAEAGRVDFTASVEAPLEPAWVDPDGPARRRLAAVAVDELVLSWRAELGLAAIDEAGRWLR